MNAELGLTFFFSTALTAAWLWFFLRTDKNPEPPLLLARTFGWGMLAWGSAALLEACFGLWWAGAVGLFVLAALVEEGLKMVASSTALASPEFDEPLDGLIYAVTAALGFAYAENLTYALGFGSGVAAWHLGLTTLAHALFSVPQGYSLSRAAFGGKAAPQRAKELGSGFLLSAALHAAFNGFTKFIDGWVQAIYLGILMASLLAAAFWAYRRFGKYSVSDA